MPNKRHYSGQAFNANNQSGIPIKEYNQLFDSNIDLVLYHANITELSNIDAIVNPTGSHFQHNGGCSRAIVTTAGFELLNEFTNFLATFKYLDYGQVFTSDSYGMAKFYKKILSIRSPDAKIYAMQPDLIQLTFSNLLIESFVEMNLNSFVTPLIGTGINNVPLECCVKDLIDSIQTFVNKTHKNFNPSLKRRICVVDNNLSILKQVSDLIEKKIPITTNSSQLQPSAPLVPNASSSDENIKEKKAKNKDDDTKEKETCVICMDKAGCEPNTHAKRLEKCGHVFCNTCIDEYFSNVKQHCPVCGTVYGVSYGNQPNGTMTHKIINQTLPGFEKKTKTIEIFYSFPGGIQAANHPNPGRPYAGTTRIAYLPDNSEGRKVLDLLKKSFDLKQTFTIGVSRTTGLENTITWNDIHHKTQITGGAANFGYPDPTYLNRVTEELAAKGVV